MNTLKNVAVSCLQGNLQRQFDVYTTLSDYKKLLRMASVGFAGCAVAVVVSNQFLDSEQRAYSWKGILNVGLLAAGAEIGRSLCSRAKDWMKQEELHAPGLLAREEEHQRKVAAQNRWDLGLLSIIIAGKAVAYFI